jgi:ABC-type maltose transport system permease subunit
MDIFGKTIKENMVFNEEMSLRSYLQSTILPQVVLWCMRSSWIWPSYYNLGHSFVATNRNRLLELDDDTRRPWAHLFVSAILYQNWIFNSLITHSSPISNISVSSSTSLCKFAGYIQKQTWNYGKTNEQWYLFNEYHGYFDRFSENILFFEMQGDFD